MSWKTHGFAADVEASRARRNRESLDASLRDLAEARALVQRSCRVRDALRHARLREECRLMALFSVFSLINVDAFTRDDLMVLCSAVLAALSVRPELLLGRRAAEVLCDLFEALHIDSGLLHDLASRDIVAAERHGAWLVTDEQYERFLRSETRGTVAEPLQRVVKALTVQQLDAGLVLADVRRLAEELACHPRDHPETLQQTARTGFFWAIAGLVNACFRAIHLEQPRFLDDLQERISKACKQLSAEKNLQQGLLLSTLAELARVPSATFSAQQLDLLRSTQLYAPETALLLTGEGHATRRLDQLADVIAGHQELRDELDESMWQEAFLMLVRTCLLQLSFLPLCLYRATGRSAHLLALMADPRLVPQQVSLTWVAQVLLSLHDLGLSTDVLEQLVFRSSSSPRHLLLAPEAPSFLTAKTEFEAYRTMLSHVGAKSAAHRASERFDRLRTRMAPQSPEQHAFLGAVQGLAAEVSAIAGKSRDTESPRAGDRRRPASSDPHERSERGLQASSSFRRAQPPHRSQDTQHQPPALQLAKVLTSASPSAPRSKSPESLPMSRSASREAPSSMGHPSPAVSSRATNSSMSPGSFSASTGSDSASSASESELHTATPSSSISQLPDSPPQTRLTPSRSVSLESSRIAGSDAHPQLTQGSTDTDSPDFLPRDKVLGHPARAQEGSNKEPPSPAPPAGARRTPAGSAPLSAHHQSSLLGPSPPRTARSVDASRDPSSEASASIAGLSQRHGHDSAQEETFVHAALRFEDTQGPKPGLTEARATGELREDLRRALRMVRTLADKLEKEPSKTSRQRTSSSAPRRTCSTSPKTAFGSKSLSPASTASSPPVSSLPDKAMPNEILEPRAHASTSTPPSQPVTRSMRTWSAPGSGSLSRDSISPSSPFPSPWGEASPETVVKSRQHPRSSRENSDHEKVHARQRVDDHPPPQRSESSARSPQLRGASASRTASYLEAAPALRKFSAPSALSSRGTELKQ